MCLKKLPYVVVASGMSEFRGGGHHAGNPGVHAAMLRKKFFSWERQFLPLRSSNYWMRSQLTMKGHLLCLENFL